MLTGDRTCYDATGAIAFIGSVAAFDHDLDGRPVSRTLNGVTKLFRFGGAIAYSTAGTPLEMDLGDAVFDLVTGGIRFRHRDFRGNVQFVSKGNGTVDGYASYRAFGTQSITGSLGERGFAGGFEIPSLGLVVLGPRVLDADAGRFLSQDPVFNAVNLYAYAQGNPVYFWDPTGRHPTGGLEGLNLNLGSLGSFSFDLPLSGGNPAASGGGAEHAPPRGIETIIVRRERNRLDKTGQILVATYLIAHGVEMIAIGFEAVSAGVAFSPATGGISLIGSGGGLVIAIIGVVEVGAGVTLMGDAGVGAGGR